MPSNTFPRLQASAPSPGPNRPPPPPPPPRPPAQDSTGWVGVSGFGYVAPRNVLVLSRSALPTDHSDHSQTTLLPEGEPRTRETPGGGGGEVGGDPRMEGVLAPGTWDLEPPLPPAIERCRRGTSPRWAYSPAKAVPSKAVAVEPPHPFARTRGSANTPTAGMSVSMSPTD